MTSTPERPPTLEDALVGPALALQRANRALASVTLEHVQRGLRAGAGGGAEPVRIPLEVPPGARRAAPGSARPARVEAPVLGLLPMPNMAIRGATVDLTWECAGTAAVGAGGGAAARRRLVGEPGAPRALARASNRALKLDLRLSLREASPTEGGLQIQDRLNSLVRRPDCEGGGTTR